MWCVHDCTAPVLSGTADIINNWMESSRAVPEAVDAVVVGCGFFGLVSLFRAVEAGLDAVAFEATSSIGGCWNTQANTHSHVTVAEPSYRFPMPDCSFQQSDYTSREELLSHAANFVEARSLQTRIHFETRVTALHEETDGTFTVTTTQGDSSPPVETKAKAVILCVGAQTRRREVVWPGEESFEGDIHYGSGNEVKGPDAPAVNEAELPWSHRWNQRSFEAKTWSL